MIKLYAICYDFNRPVEHRYMAFFEYLKTVGPWCHYLLGTWLVATSLTADEIRNKLASFLDKDISLLIMEVGQDISGWLPKNAWEWIQEQQAELNRQEVGANGHLTTTYNPA
jgi:hypothetical protein